MQEMPFPYEVVQGYILKQGERCFCLWMMKMLDAFLSLEILETHSKMWDSLLNLMTMKILDMNPPLKVGILNEKLNDSLL